MVSRLWRGRLGRVTLRLALAMLVLVAVVMTLVRVALAQPRYLTPMAERVVAAVTDEPVAFDAVSGRLRGFSPELTLDGVRLGEAARELRLDSLVLRLDAAASLWQWEPVLAGVRVRGADIEVKRHADGSIRVQGRQDNLLAKIPFPEQVRLADIAIDWRDGERRPLRLRSVTVNAVADGDGVRLDARARLADGGGRIRLRAALASLPRAAEPFRGRIHLDASDIPAARLRERTSQRLADAPTVGGRLDGELWLTWRDGGLSRATGSGRWGQAQWAGRSLAEALSGQVHWQAQAGGWRLSARGGKGSHGDASRIAIARDATRGGWRLAAQALPIHGLKRQLLAERQRLPEPASRWLEAVEPTGQLERLIAGWQGGDWRIESTIQDVAVAPDGRRPGIDGLELSVSADPDGGRVSARLADSNLRWPAIIRAPLKVNAGQGELGWRRSDDGDVVIRLAGSEWAGPLMAGRARGAMRIGPAGQPRVTGRASLERGDGSALLARLTQRAREQASLTWLARALDRATLTGGNLRFDGPVSGLSFDNPAATTRLRMGFRHARLDYAEDWPSLDDVAGHFTLSGDGLALRVAEGTIAGLAFDGGARLPNLDEPELTVRGRAQTGLNDWRSLLERTPLSVPPVLDRVSLEGRAGLALELGFRPDQKAGPAVSGNVSLDGVSVHQPASGYRLEALTGMVAFDERGLRWQDVTGEWRGRPVTSKGWTQGSGASSRIRTITRVTAALPEMLPPGSGEELPVSGRSQWLLDLSLPGFAANSDRWRAELSSDLSGLAVALPEPLGKTADEARGFSLAVSGGPDGPSPVRLRYGQAIKAVVGLDASGITRGDLRLGGEAAELPTEPGFRIGGELETVDAQQLRAYASLRPADSDPSRMPPVRAVELRVGKLKLGHYAVRDIQLKAQPSDGGWRLRLDGPNTRGVIRSGDDRPIDAEMERLAIERLTTNQARDVSPPISGIPALDVRIANLRLDGRSLGQLRLRSGPRDNQGLALDELVLDNSSMLLRAKGGWDPGSDRSQLEVTVETVDAGRVLGRFGAARTMSGGAGRLGAELAWDGHLLRPDVASLDGRLDLTLRDGSLPTLEPGAGRVFGLLSLSLLPRRLMLDFAPITGEGLPFDRIRAAFTIEDGLARPDPCYLAGPMARINVRGSVDLVKRVYDQRITVTPRVSSTLPLVGGLAAGPPAALLLLLGQDIVADGVAPLTRLEYRLTGPWADPLLERAGRGLMGPATDGG